MTDRFFSSVAQVGQVSLVAILGAYSLHVTQSIYQHFVLVKIEQFLKFVRKYQGI